MKSERHEQTDKAFRIFQSAIELVGVHRTDFLDRACAGDAELRREVEDLLAYDEKAQGFIESPAYQEAAELIADEQDKTLVGESIGRFKIVSLLGAGGMGEVYLAEDTRLGRKVAIKFLPLDSDANEQAGKRLIREAQTAAKLDHPNICAIHEVVKEKNCAFIVMQYVQGETLSTRIQNRPPEFREALDLAVQVADALSEAHSRGIIHRDIKPQNIMITARGQVKVLDFGLAKFVQQRPLLDSSAETESLLTEPGLILGTVPYMSPEQVRGESLDGRSDIFSFGTLLYEVVSRVHPFTADSAVNTISAILTREPAPLARYSRDVPAEMERIVSKALRKEKEERYQTVKDLLIDLKNLRDELAFEAKFERNKSPEPINRASSQSPAHNDKLAAHKTELITRHTAGLTNRLRLIEVIIGASLIAAAIVGYYYFLAPDSKSAINLVAVLPFVNESGNTDVEYLSDGMTESLINSLSQLPNLSVKARSTVFRYRGKDVEPHNVGKELNVEAILSGRVVQRGDQLTLSLELVDVRTGNQLWGEQYNRRLTDLAALQSEIARDVSRKLRARLSNADVQKVTKNYTENSKAYELYLRGHHEWNRFTPQGLMKSIDYYNQAITIDPTYALAYSALAASYSVQGNIGLVPPKEAYAKSKWAAEKAVELDAALAEMHAPLIGFKLFHEWNWLGAEREFKRLLEFNPNFSHAHLLYGYYLGAMGRVAEAELEAKRARELEPLSPLMNKGVGMSYYFARQYDEAIEECSRALEIDSNFLLARLFLGQAYERKGMYEQAIAEYQKGRSASANDPAAVGLLGHAYAASGKRGEAMKMIDELKEMSKQRYVSPYNVALIYTGLRENHQALTWLEKAYEARDYRLIWLKVEPQFEGLHLDPRFSVLLRRIGLLE